MKEKKDKAFVLRMPKKTWLFLKRLSIKKEKSMNDLVLDAIKKVQEEVN